MSRAAAWIDKRKALARGLPAAAMALLIGSVPTGIAASGASRSWSVAVHIEYANGTVYEHAFAVGVQTSDLPAILAECGSAHRGGSAVQYHCFPIPE